MPPNLINSSAVAFANHYLGKNQKNLQASIKRLASGKKIAGPNDDPGNLAVSMKLNAQLSRISGDRNSIQNGISFLEVQDGALETAGRMLNRLKEIYTQFKVGLLSTSEDTESYNSEFKNIQSQLYGISQSKFCGVSLFAEYSNEGSRARLGPTSDGHPTTNDSHDNTLSIGSSDFGFKISIHKSPILSALTIVEFPPGEFDSFAYIDNNPSTYGFTLAFPRTLASQNNPLSLGTLKSWDDYGDNVDGFLDWGQESIAVLRAQNGSTQSRLNFASDNLDSYETGLRSAISRIEDVDIAEESANLAKHSILTQASAAMVSQANNSSQSTIRLLLGT